MAYPVLPDELQREYDNTARIYEVAIYGGHYNEALAVIKSLYNKMLDWQKKYNQRFHKGFPIHNIGYTLHLLNKNDEALRYFILAYIEDLLSADRLEEADATPAGRTLFLGYKYSPESLQLLKQIVGKFKKKEEIPLNPEEVMEELKESKTGYQDIECRVTIIKKEAPLSPFTIFNKGWHERVFVGGSIGLGFIIDKIAEIVGELGYEPIICHRCQTPKEMETDIRRKCLVLLHCCKYAVFDVAEQKGQLVEIDRAPEYGISTLVVWPNTKEKEVTEMLKSLVHQQQITSKSYIKFPEDVKAIIEEFLNT